MQVCTLLQTDDHTSTPPLSFLQAGCPSCCPTNSVKAQKANRTYNKISSYAAADAYAVWCPIYMHKIITDQSGCNINTAAIQE